MAGTRERRYVCAPCRSACKGSAASSISTLFAMTADLELLPPLEANLGVHPPGRKGQEPRRPAGGVESDCPLDRRGGPPRQRAPCLHVQGQAGQHHQQQRLERARRAAGLVQVRVHDLKHTFGRRLRAAGVPVETRKVLLGHRNGDITTHYSAPELEERLEAANRVCAEKSGIGCVENKSGHRMTR
jgi:integrase